MTVRYPQEEQLITKLAKDFPDVKELLEYEDYVQKPTKGQRLVAHHAGAGGTLEAGAANGWLSEVHRNTSSCGASG
mgnify:CR=1 FL=1